jgi:FkbM family methyltransferase
MIFYNGLSEDKKTIFYSTKQELLKVRVEVYEASTNGFMFSNELDLYKDFNYYTFIPIPYKDRKVLFFDRETNNLIVPFIIDGFKTLSDLDKYGYLEKVLKIDTNKAHQAGINDVIREHFWDRNYSEKYDIEEGDVVVDIGFNFGIFSMGALNKGASKIYGFEPNKNIYQIVKDIFPEKEKVKIYNLAVSDKDEILTFFEGNNTLSSSLMNKVVDFKEMYDVRSVNIINFFNNNQINHIDFLKVDCEGAEYSIFESIPDDFLKKIKKIHVEFHFNKGNEVKFLIEKLERCGFDWEFDHGANENSNIGLIFARKKPKNIVCISSYCDTQEKKEVLEKNIDLLLSNNLDVAVISPISLPDSIIEKCQYTFLTNENPILDWPDHAMFFWKDIYVKDEIYRITATVPDYGWAGLLHVKRLGEIVRNYHYDYFGFIIYDSDLTEDHLQILKSGRDGIVFPSKRGNETWPVGLHLMCFNKKNLNSVLEKITLQNYLKEKSFDAFQVLHREIVIPLNLKIGNIPVEDKVFYYDKFDNIFNYSEFDKFKFHASSPAQYTENVKLFFYQETEEFELKVIVDGKKSTHKVSFGTTIDLGKTRDELSGVIIEYNGVKSDITSKLKKIKNNCLDKIQ